MAIDNCYVCGEQLLAGDKTCTKRLDGIRFRHIWHMGPNDSFNYFTNTRYALTLEDAKNWAESKLQDGYKAPEQRVEVQQMLDEVNRLLIKRQPEPPY